ncbi:MULTISPECIES: hypothetical protein [Acinetobacter calcoaceticus/baumannii complex]|uniref:hypothetical protein n=1 Tax=Acinetobacter calcoaceticus/baumannii complex TaxID=909768 RepID=UPI00045213E6|nr:MULTISPECIES: hypothetical protein [Acinetobacter calcoaceticus/baumannii complex]EXE91401.1 hypothetical protein J594_4144 [Acinetobacter sp. 259052]EXE93957.1 hypothetical protein J594_4007 [Acinetobacter sp. 259052]EYT12592.1 hypothetical protein J595_04159 [Acinetobacter sp. 1592897]EYT12621.1 hypothetical protein J595_04148 [Acinetobacter sp. 1592897]EYT12813.1 hypothetical protein J595_04010 [Acinetobacter sp. 1592897]
MMSLQDVTVLNTFVFNIFVVGVILGFVVSGLFSNVLNTLSYRFERPKRIRTETGYLYLFKGKYYPIEQRNKLLEESRKRFKHLSH